MPDIAAEPNEAVDDDPNRVAHARRMPAQQNALLDWSIILSNLFSSTCSTGSCAMFVPALLTRMSILPHSWWTVFTSRSILFRAARMTSQRQHVAFDPGGGLLQRLLLAGANRQGRVAPSRAKAAAMASPKIPRLRRR